MASPAQLHANRLNAQRSTGPRSEQGKAVSRFNALKYGLEARSRVIPGEDPAELETLAAGYHRQFHPAGPLEDYLVEAIVAADWNRRRYTRVEAQLYRMLMLAAPDAPDAPAAAFAGDVTGAKILQSVFRQLASAERSFFRALAELRRAQKERKADEEEEDEEAAASPPAAVPQPPPIGFVLQNPPKAAELGMQQSGAGASACQRPLGSGSL